MKHPGDDACHDTPLGGGAPPLGVVTRVSSSTPKSGAPPLLADGLSGELELGSVTWISASSTAPKSGAPRLRGSTAGAAVDVIIRRIRPGARNVDPGEYDPHHVSIGPYHFRQPQGSAEHDKQVGLAAVLSEAPSGMAAAEASCADELTRLEGRARRCYGEDIDMESGEFVRMLLVDGCYLLACFGSDYGSAAGLTADTLAVVRDVFYLAENQIPFFVLEKIAGLTTSSSDTTAPLDDIKQYATDLLKMRRYSMAEPMPTTTAPGNLLHLLRMHLNPTELPPTCGGGGGEKVTRWRTATDYHLSGVNIESRAINAAATQCILDVKLSGGTLAIPCLDIDGQTWRLLRNLMALEQHNRGTVASHVTAYCVFMSQLASEAADVELLGRRKVVVHSHGNDGEVARCFADLCKGISFDIDDPDANYLRTTWQEVEERCRSRRSRWLAWLRRKYFSNPWVTIGLVAGAIGLTCAIIQAVYSVLSYRKGPK